MVIVITGAVGVGKTTVCQKLVEIARGRGYRCGGVVTSKTGDGSTITVEDIGSGRSELLASARETLGGPCTNRYSFSPGGLLFGAGAIEKGKAARLLVVDEVGQLELRDEGFSEAVDTVKGHQGAVVVIRKHLLDEFMPAFRPKPLMFETTVENRDRLPGEIARALFGESGE